MALIKKTKVESTAVAKATDYDPFADAGRGSEQVRSQDLIIPRLTLVHEMSRITKKQRAEYVPGAKGGMFCVPGLQRLWEGEEGIHVIPVLYQRRLIEWTPIEAGGGLIRMDVPEEELDQFERKNPGVYITPNDTEVVVTPEYYLLIVDDDTGESIAAVTSMTGKKAAVSKRWNTLIMSQRRTNPNTNQDVLMPFWFNTYHMISKPDSNDQGDFYVPGVSVLEETLKLKNGQKFYGRAKELYAAVQSGIAKAQDVEDGDR